MKKALIFGMDGFVGKYMAEELIQHGYDIYACNRFGNSTNPYNGWYSCDLNNYDQVKNVVAEVAPTHIINLAGQSNVGISWRIPRLTIETNVCGAINIIEAVHECNLECSLLMIGSSEEYGISDKALTEDSALDASNPYGISKMMLERFCDIFRKRYGMKIHYVRSFNHTGLGQTDNFVIPSWCKQVAEITKSGKDGKMYVGNLDIVRDFSNVIDIVNAYRLIVESDDSEIVYNVGNGEGVPLRAILNHLLSLSNQKITVEVDPKLIRPIENPYICCDSTLLKEHLGWKPKYSIYTTVEQIYNFYLEKDNK